jgi:ribokinase
MSEEHKKPIVVVGSLNMDLVVRTPRHPKVGETLIGSGFGTYPGGKGANQAVAAARLGAPVRMIGRVGADAFGDALLATVARDGVDTRYIKKDSESPSGVALIAVDDAGANTIIVASGANMRLTAEDVSAAEAAFEGAGALLLQLESPLPAIERAIELAHKHRVQVILNPAPARTLEAKLLQSVDYLIPNETESQLLVEAESVGAAVTRLKELGIPNLIVTLGGDGLLVESHAISQHIPAYRVKAVDTVAAGDAFVGGFAVALSEGLSIMDAATFGNAAAAIAVTRPGAQPSLPNRAELEAFLKNNK